MWVWIELPLGLVGQSWYPKTLLIIVERVSSQSFTLPDSFSVITLFFQVWFSINNFTKFPRCRSLKEKENTNKWIHGNKGEENGKWMPIFLETLLLGFISSLARPHSQLSTLAPMNICPRFCTFFYILTHHLLINNGKINCIGFLTPCTTLAWCCTYLLIICVFYPRSNNCWKTFGRPSLVLVNEILGP